ncbi:hypothetical protein P5V15_007374 [Pogonomyrmex californicus]
MMRFLLPLTLALATCWASDPITEDVPPQPMQKVSENYRLPDDVEPTAYNIKLETFLDEPKEKSFTFEGVSVIDLTIKKNTNTITFHAMELNIRDIKLTQEDKKKPLITLKNMTIDKEKDFVTLNFENTLSNTMKDVKLTITYTGKINDELRGFYKSSYQDKDKQTKWLATTHLQPVSARRVFPCWDEPSLKAKFTISITVPPNGKYNVISNMQRDNKDEKDKTFSFKPTPKMSTYLVAFVVSDFNSLPNNVSNFKVWANPTVQDDSKQFALEYGKAVLTELSDFTGIDYYNGQKMPKMDQVAIPHLGGAMENWGLVTYREPLLLLMKDKTTVANWQQIATIIAHELSHQWFGNLVTCSWWDHIWLNEGFATFFQYYIADKVIPKMYEKQNWRLMEQFVVKNTQASSFVVDASIKTRALSPKISAQTPTQIQGLFDDIAYKKGASILHMMQEFLSKDVFKKGLNTYLRDYANNSVEPKNLFTSIEKSDEGKKLKDYLPENVDLTKVMNNWIYEPGYPVINVKRNNTGVLNITQERFFLVKSLKQDQTQWYVPLTYVTEAAYNDVQPKDKKNSWLVPGASKTFEHPNKEQWILFNKDQAGYYRVNYDDDNWKRLAQYLDSPNYKNISATNRAQLIDDALNLARAGYLSYNISMMTTVYLRNETDYIPWYAAVRAFNYLDNLLFGAKEHPTYHKYVAHKIENFAKRTNYTNPNTPGSHVDKLAKVLALDTACRYGLKHCEDFATKKFNDWLNKKENETDKNLDVNLRSGILCAALRNTEKNREKWNKVVEKYKNTEDKTEKAELLAALGCAKTKGIPEAFLELTLQNEPVVNIFDAMNSISMGNAGSFDILMKFINDNIKKIEEITKQDDTKLTALLSKLANKVTTSKQYVELSLLIRRQLLGVEKAEELIHVAIDNLAWIEAYRGDLEKWIREHKPQSDSASSVVLTSFVLIISLFLTRLY